MSGFPFARIRYSRHSERWYRRSGYWYDFTMVTQIDIKASTHIFFFILWSVKQLGSHLCGVMSLFFLGLSDASHLMACSHLFSSHLSLSLLSKSCHQLVTSRLSVCKHLLVLLSLVTKLGIHKVIYVIFIL